MLSLIYCTYQRLFNKDQKAGVSEVQLFSVLALTIVLMFMIKLMTLSGSSGRTRGSLSAYNFESDDQEDKGAVDDYDDLIKGYLDWSMKEETELQEEAENSKEST
uniref:Uncharacterized protein n=1 Tax=Tetranychus urticae TaxID=32264 RepID=T1KHA4_TETUR